MKCGAGGYGRDGKLVAPDPATGTGADDLAATACKDMADARTRIDRRRAHLGLPPATDDEFLAEYEAELTALLHPPLPAPGPAPAYGNAFVGAALVLVGLVAGTILPDRFATQESSKVVHDGSPGWGPATPTSVLSRSERRLSPFAPRKDVGADPFPSARLRATTHRAEDAMTVRFDGPAPMPAEYFEARFRSDGPADDWPAEFVIITAYPTTGESWPLDQCLAADRRLEAELRRRGTWLRRVTGYSPTTGHAEPGWAADLPLDVARSVGRAYLQDAIYHVAGDELFVTRCTDAAELVPVGGFRERLTAVEPGGETPMQPWLTAAALLAGPTAFAGDGDWTKLPPLPDREGFAGPFAGISRGALLVAGGANFPDRKPWEGGKKVWYDTVFVLPKADGEWRAAGKLPRPLAYGVCVTHGPGVVCVGGSDADRHYADAFRLEWADGKLVTTPLPLLPQPVTNACGALVGDTLYFCGGQPKPDAPPAATAWRIDLSAREPAWSEIPACPGGGRMLATAAGFDKAFWVIGGVDLVAGKDKPGRRYLADAYRYDPGKGWTRIADLPHPVAAAPSPAPVDAAGFYVLGGDDGSQIGTAPERHPGFGGKVLRFDLASGKWTEAGTVAAPRVTVPCVRWDRMWVVPSGEARPGVRSPDVWAWTPR